MTYTAAQLIQRLHLMPHPEGGWFAFRQSSGQTFSDLPGFPGRRDSCSYIYYLLQRGEISRWHRLQATEVWTWHQGGSLEMTLGGTGEQPLPCSTQRLGSRLELGEEFQFLAPAHQWQTTRVVDGEFVLVSCVVSPAFQEEDCLLPEQPLSNEIYE